MQCRREKLPRKHAASSHPCPDVGEKRSAASGSASEHALEERTPVRTAMGSFDEILGMWHQAQHIARPVHDACDVVDGTVGVRALRVAENHLALALDARERLGVGEEIPS